MLFFFQYFLQMCWPSSSFQTGALHIQYSCLNLHCRCRFCSIILNLPFNRYRVLTILVKKYRSQLQMEQCGQHKRYQICFKIKDFREHMNNTDHSTFPFCYFFPLRRLFNPISAHSKIKENIF